MAGVHASTVLVATAALTVLTAGACGDSREDLASAAVRDSAGVTLIHYERAALERASSLALTEVLRIGTLDGPLETQFFSLADAVEYGDEIFLLDRGHSEVRVFAADGTHLRSFGGEGDGPGEFRRPSAIELLSDTLVVRGARVNVMDIRGTLLATGPARAGSADGFLLRVLPTSVGWIGEWMRSPDQSVPRGEPFREVMSFHHVELATAERNAEIFSYERPENRVSRGNFPFYVQPYFLANPFHDVGLDGSIFHTPGSEYRVEVRDGRDGRLVRRITADPSPAPITGRLLDRLVDLDRERVREAPPGSEMAQFGHAIDEKLALGTADNLPVLGRMYISESGWLLVTRLDLDPDPVTSGDPTTLDLFDPQGRLTGRLTLGSDTRILRLNDDGLLAVVRDDLDVQTLVKYRFERP